jgi:hypothetical protein
VLCAVGTVWGGVPHATWWLCAMRSVHCVGEEANWRGGILLCNVLHAVCTVWGGVPHATWWLCAMRSVHCVGEEANRRGDNPLCNMLHAVCTVWGGVPHAVQCAWEHALQWCGISLSYILLSIKPYIFMALF